MTQRLSQDRLVAFFEVVRHSSFSKAASALGVTQSALSHRIKNLETELGITLLFREPTGLRLTAAGEKLLQYCRTQFQIEDEFLAGLKRHESNSFSGSLRVAAVSSLAWSVVVPALAPLVRNHSEIHLEVSARELNDLPLLLKRGNVDYIVTIAALSDSVFEEHRLGDEHYRLAESTAKWAQSDVYLDHDEADMLTMEYLNLRATKRKTIRRCYLDDIHGLLAGLKLGLGKALVPRHLLKNQAGVRVVPGTKSLIKPVWLYYLRQPFYSKLHSAFVKTMLENVAELL